MSVFTNPASASTDHTKAYTAAVLDLLGTRDPFVVLRSTEAALRRGVDGLSHQQLTRPEATGKWSIRHVVQHLADSELVWGYRLRMVLAHNRPPLVGYDQDLWADRLRYNEADTHQALEVFGVLRAANLRLLDGASNQDLDRAGLHAERGEESVRHMMQLYAGHDLLHLNQIERIRHGV
jgi:hypothetical protein